MVVVHAVLVVVALVGGVQVPVVDVVDVVAVRDRRVPALGAVLVGVGLGDVVPPAADPWRSTAVTTAVTTKSATASSTMVPPEGVLSG